MQDVHDNSVPDGTRGPFNSGITLRALPLFAQRIEGIDSYRDGYLKRIADAGSCADLKGGIASLLEIHSELSSVVTATRYFLALARGEVGHDESLLRFFQPSEFGTTEFLSATKFVNSWNVLHNIPTTQQSRSELVRSC
jgi:hypothetical protein